MVIALRFVGGYSSFLDRREDQISVEEGTTMRQFLDTLALTYGESFDRRVRTDSGELRSDCRLFSGKEDVSTELDAEVQPCGVTVFFLEGMAGGEI